ncbi:Rpr2-domain-containing protein [Aspergillus steynii IBT 23096]|uniref:Rpr2-domain-containing protein n=1 Tax=Aspergillus steynii IBT 23096 TaxID=1392250 RepID=A0A2I2G8N1_9EURO|nr:Rpr2-domain-containing protein [Aspergillus steynii IBT 23096]PLB49235.1 Rpr2-domain-containing protein [Aspergillus steynii IBT 23096]
MAKVKGKKGVAGGVNSHIRARLNYLHAAATYLQTGEIPSRRSTGPDPVEGAQAEDKESEPVSARIVPQVVNDDEAIKEESTTAPTPTSLNPNLSRVLISHMRGVSLKSQLRLPVEVKRSFCKRCETLLVPGVNYVQEIRNDSRGRSKPWADVLVVRCTTCGTEKRFPQAEKRSKKLAERRKMQEPTEKPATAS